MDVFDEDAGVRAGTAEVDNDVVCALNGFLFQHAARLLAFHDLPYLFDVVDFKGDVGNAALAVIEVLQDAFARNDEFNGRAVFIFLGKDEVGMVGVDEAGIVDFKAVGFYEIMSLFKVGRTMPIW